MRGQCQPEHLLEATVHRQTEGYGDPKCDLRAVLHAAQTESCMHRAQAGHADAMMKLSIMYLDGAGVDEDDQMAMQWMKLSAEAGNAGACISLEG